MVKLTENMIIKLAKSTNLEKVRKLNLWACNLTEISVLKKVPNLTIASLSSNHLSSLADLSCCYGLEELYIRRNNIQSLAELKYLKSLQNLRVLWLEGSPCTEIPDYRLAVLHLLPKLQRLDNLVVEDSEVDLARELYMFPSGVTRQTPVESQGISVVHQLEISDDLSCSATDGTHPNNLKLSGSESFTSCHNISNAPSCGNSIQTCRSLLTEVSPTDASRSQASIANILQAVLCLLSELDPDNLQAVSRAVRGRLMSL